MKQVDQSHNSQLHEEINQFKTGWSRKDAMVSKLGAKLFPKDTRFEQRRKTMMIFLIIIGMIALAGAVALVMIRLSQVNFQSR